jgi:hypothetical protein
MAVLSTAPLGITQGEVAQNINLNTHEGIDRRWRNKIRYLVCLECSRNEILLRPTIRTIETASSMKTAHLLPCTLAALAGFATAATIITPSGATSTTALSGRTMTEAINGSLLTSTDPDVLNWTHSLMTGTSGYWLSASGAATSGTEVITLGFASPITVNKIYVWNYHRENPTWDDRALGSFIMSLSTDNGATYPTSIMDFQLSDIRNTSLTAVPTEAFSFATQTGVTHIKLTNLKNLHQVYGTGAPDADSNYIGVGEIRFDSAAIPEPSTAVLSGLVLSLGLLRRRRRGNVEC